MGMWNDSDAIPLMVRSAFTMKVLPKLNTDCNWLPVDTLADCVLELGGILIDGEAEKRDVEEGGGELELFYNIVSPHNFSWERDFLPVLCAAGLDFESVGFEEWIGRLKRLAASSSSSSAAVLTPGNGCKSPAADPDRNPAIKLVQYYETSFGKGEDEEGKK
ncbi:MAG: hypothetical protein Q9190_007991, partial [Brigantiaea leucoxantha]